ncbi:MAG: carboxypeptidase-like regulatory domain-containing protein [Acidimicrobiales bacterium]
MRRPVLALALLALVAAGCSGSEPEAAAPPSTVEETTTVAPSTTSSTVRPTTTTGPPRTTTTTLVTMGPGDASIGGTVFGPAGPVDGATVRVERLVGRAVATADVTTSGGGAWHLGSILGGSYRVRAFKSPELAQSRVEAFFLAATERRTMDFRLVAAGGERITAAVNPNPPRVDQQATVTIQVGVGTVDDQGRASLSPRPGVPVALSSGAGIVLESSPQAVTDATGSASWLIRCAAVGADTLPLTVGTGVTNVKIPACAAPGSGPPTTRRS